MKNKEVTPLRITLLKNFKENKEVDAILAEHTQTKIIRGIVNLVIGNPSYLEEDLREIISRDIVWDWNKVRVQMPISFYLEENKRIEDDEIRAANNINPYIGCDIYNGKKDGIRAKLSTEDYNLFKSKMSNISNNIVGMSTSALVMDVIEMLIHREPIMPTAKVLGKLMGINKKEIGNSREVPKWATDKRDFAKKQSNLRAKMKRDNERERGDKGEED